LRPIILGTISSKNPVGKIEDIHIICHEKLLLKTMWENKEKMTYIVHACTDIASLKTLHEKPLGKLTKEKSAIPKIH
jgi:hypothetical protein